MSQSGANQRGVVEAPDDDFLYGESSLVSSVAQSDASKSSKVTQLTERVFPRLQAKAEYQVCLGFDQIFSSLPSVDDGWCGSSDDIPSSIEKVSESPDGDLLCFSSYEEVMSDVDLEQAEVSHVDVVDMSAGGFRLEVDVHQVGHPKVGEVLGVREHSSSDWKLCVIRWVRPCGEVAQLGVEMLASAAYKTLLRNPYTQAVISPAVYIPGISIIGLPESVLIPQSRTVVAGDKLLVRLQDGEQSYVADKTGLVTGAVKRLFISEADVIEERPLEAASGIWASF